MVAIREFRQQRPEMKHRVSLTRRPYLLFEAEKGVVVVELSRQENEHLRRKFLEFSISGEACYV